MYPSRRFLAMCTRSSRLRPPGRQRGSVLVATAGALLVSVILLASADLGYLFFMKREFQKVADLSALAGAQRIDKFNCAPAIDAALGNANQNLSRFSYKLLATNNPVKCGRWDPTAPGAATTVAVEQAPPENFDGIGVRTYFGTPAAGVEFNAVRVAFTQSVPALLGLLGSHVIGVQAIATRDAPLSTFSVGSKLAAINPAGTPLGALLTLVGANVPAASLVGYNGLAQAKVTPSGLLQALGIPVSADIGIGELNNLLAARQVDLGTLLNAVATVGGQTALAATNLTVVNAVKASLGVQSLNVQLGSTSTVGGLFASITAPGATVASALNAQVNALDLITAAVGVATSQRGISTAISTSSIAGITATAKLGIVEPPSIGIGGIGTKAYTAQVRLYSHVTTSGGGLLSSLLNLLGTTIDLPIIIDVVSSMGTLTDMNCGASPPTATINVDSTIMKACMGKFDESLVFSTQDACSAANVKDQVFAKVLDINLLAGQVHVDALPSPTTPVTLKVGETKSTGQNPLTIGTTVSNLMSQLLGLVLGQTSTSGTGGNVGGLSATSAAQVADKYLTKYAYNPTTIATNMANDGVTWGRPCLIGLLTCAMPEVWKGQVTPLIGSCNNTCKRDALISNLQTAASGGLVSSLLGGVGNLLTSLLGGTTASPQNLLQTILMPVFNLLKPILDAVGVTLSNLLQSLLGVDLGVTDVKLMSLSCNNSRLVY